MKSTTKNKIKKIFKKNNMYMFSSIIIILSFLVGININTNTKTGVKETSVSVDKKDIIEDIISDNIDLTNCEEGNHIEGEICINNTKECKIDGMKGTQNWDEFNKEWQECYPVPCIIGSDENGLGCESIKEECGIENGIGEKTLKGDVWTECIPVKCKIGFHIENNICVND